ncbi:MAG TPA: hypothetical protein VF650_04360 [Allosphingosinicella sp.]|jgi:hypothetical protein
MKIGSLKQLKTAYFRRLNDIHIASQLTRAALAAYGHEPSVTKGKRYRYFEVPSGGKPTARIRRHKTDVAEIVAASRDHGELQKSLVLAVAVTEDFLLNALKMVLRAYPDRLLRGLRGGEARLSIDFEVFLTRERNDVIEEQIAARLQHVFYASPAAYLQFMSQALEIAVPEDALTVYLEIKASRDVVVHGNGIADAQYERKAGALARAGAGSVLPVNEAYFDQATAALKALIGSISDALATRYSGDVRVAFEISRLFVS